MKSVEIDEEEAMENRTWRLIQLEINDAYTNMAIDEAILRQRQENKVPDTFRLYRWKPSAVSIGCFQGIHQEVNLEACKKRGFDVVRRITGGGAVFHSYEGEVTYSLVTPVSNPIIPNKLLDSYSVLCQGVVEACRRIGLDTAEFKPVNDVLVNGKKISGNAQTRKRGFILQHGTVLVGFDPAVMFEVLRVSQAKISDKLIKSVYKRVTSIQKELHRNVEHETVANALIKGFEAALGIKLEQGRLTQEELRLAEKIREERFKAEAWTFQR
ncbi:MAG: lipoate--protein ligase family protein [Candidatus Ranarchaeia archaeon]